MSERPTWARRLTTISLVVAIGDGVQQRGRTYYMFAFQHAADTILAPDVAPFTNPYSLFESGVDRQGCAHPAGDLLVDAASEHRIVEEQQMGREDERVFLVDFTRRCNLNPQKVIVSLLDCGSHARPFRAGLSGGQLPR